MSASRPGENRVPAPGATGRSWWRRLLILPPILLGAFVFFSFARDKAAPVQVERAETARPARVIEVAALPVAPRATGFGTVRPDRVWTAIAQVGGTVVETHPDLKRGALLPAGALLVRIDPADYQLAIARMEARAHVARTAYYDAAAKMLAGKPFKKEASIAKMIASEAAMDNARDATQIHGGYGFMNEYLVARHYRDSKILEVGEGTTEVQLMLIARELGL